MYIALQLEQVAQQWQQYETYVNISFVIQI